MSKTLLFIPCYNCEKQIPRVLKQVLSEQSHFNEVLIVDNQSMDKTLQVASNFLSKSRDKVRTAFTLLQNNHNYNLGGSHKVAFLYAIKHNFTHVVIFHGDDQARLSDLTDLLNKDVYDLDCFLGSRFHKESKLQGYSKLRIWGNRAINIMFSLSARKWITDTGSGLNLYKVSTLRDKMFLKMPDDLTFNVYFLLWFVYKKYSFCFFPLLWREEDQVSNAKVFHQGIKILGLLCRYTFKRGEVFFSILGSKNEKVYKSTVVKTFR